jgi:hypothetical protein
MEDFVRKMMFWILGSLMISSMAFAQSIAVSKAAELTAHRLDRLVVTGKIDAGFTKNLQRFDVTVDASQPPVYFKVRVSQVAPAQGAPLQLDLTFDQMGRPLSYKVVAGGFAGPDSAWPDADSVTLRENALHHMLEMASDIQMKPFYEGLTSLTLTKGTLAGKTVARAQATSSAIAQKMNVYINLDGSFNSMEVVP